MTVQKQKEKLEDEAYMVVEATNEDGTISGQVTETPYREDDDLVIPIKPLVPDSETQKFRLKWPSKDDESFEAVRLCRQKVGGFQAVSQLEGEEVRLEDTNDRWKLKVPDNNKNDKMPSIKILPISILVILFFGSMIGMATPVGLVLALPFGIEILSFMQGVSVLVGSIILFIVTTFALDELLET
jgi:hypothetical protein